MSRLTKKREKDIRKAVSIRKQEGFVALDGSCLEEELLQEIDALREELRLSFVEKSKFGIQNQNLKEENEKLNKIIERLG